MVMAEDYAATNMAPTDVESKWQDMPMDLLVRILALTDDPTVVVASGVCTGWCNSLSIGINELSFAWCNREVSNLVQSVAHKFPRLENCNIRRCSSVLNDDAIRAVGAHWHDLRALDLTRCRALTDISHIARGCPSLEKLDLSGCVSVTEAGLVGLAQQCQHLRHLNLCGCANATTDAVLLALAQNCSGLQYLNVAWCEKTTDVSVTALALGCPDLRFVDFCDCPQITDQSVIALAENCLRLRVLRLHCCGNITDAAMYALVSSSKVHSNKRSSSSTGSNKRVRDDRYYSTSYSSSDNSVGFDTSYLHDPAGFGLVSLNIGGCQALSAEAVQAVCDAFPQLHTCPAHRSLFTSGTYRLTTVHCICIVEAHRKRLRCTTAQAVVPHPLSLPLRI